MKIIPAFHFFLFINLLAAVVSYAEETIAPDPARVAAYEKMLSKSPQGVGATIEDRGAWEALAKNPAAAKVIKDAEKISETPMPELTDELFLEYSRNGNRTNFQAVAFERHNRLCMLVLAECLENRGRFLPAIEKAIAEVCSEKHGSCPPTTSTCGISRASKSKSTSSRPASDGTWPRPTIGWAIS